VERQRYQQVEGRREERRTVEELVAGTVREDLNVNERVHTLVVADRKGTRDKETLGSVLDVGSRSSGLFVHNRSNAALVADGVVLVLINVRRESSRNGVAVEGERVRRCA
jgi:hypothetical protein